MDNPRLPGEWHDDWTIVGLIGSGAYGNVYLAERMIGEKKIQSAIKIINIPSEKMRTQAFISEFGSRENARNYYGQVADDYLREISVMESLRGITNIVSIEDYKLTEKTNEVGYMIYIRMEYLTSLTDYIGSHELSEKDYIQLGIDICTALEYCEKSGIIHRDIKPDNIFVSKYGSYKLGDFGTARILDESKSTLSTKGTFAYMAPEVAEKKKYNYTVDIYSLGMVLYRLMNRNRDPFVDLNKQIIYYKDREEAAARRMAGETIPAPVDAPPEFSKVILKAIQYAPTDRYQSAEAMKNDLLALRNIADRRSEEQIYGHVPEENRQPEDSHVSSIHRRAIWVMITSACFLLVIAFHFVQREGSGRKSGGKTDKDSEPILSEISSENLEGTEASSPSEKQSETEYTTAAVSEIVSERQAETDFLYKSGTENTSEADNTRAADGRLQSISIDGTAGFIVGSSGKLTLWVNKNKLEELLQGIPSFAEAEEDIQRMIIDNFSKQFSFNENSEALQNGDVVTLAYDPDDQYNEALKKAGLRFRFSTISRVYE